MIRTSDAVAAARLFTGTPYGELDCIGLIVRVIRTAPGGVPDYRTAGTNALWASFGASEKYRDLTWRQEGVSGARAGMLAFKRSGDDVHHVGLVTGDATVVHSSSARGQVVETALDGSWQLLAVHRYIGTESASAAAGRTARPAERGADGTTPVPIPDGGRQDPTPEGAHFEAGEGAEAVKDVVQAVVNTQRDPLNVRESPVTGRVLGTVDRGCTVEVLGEGMDGWKRIHYNGLVGYASGTYLVPVAYAAQEQAQGETDAGAGGTPVYTSLMREDGVCIGLAGRWRVAED